MSGCLPCAGFSHRAQAAGCAGSAVVACGLQSTGWVVVTCRLNCSRACGIFLDQGLNPCLLHWQVNSTVCGQFGLFPVLALTDVCLYVFWCHILNKYPIVEMLGPRVHIFSFHRYYLMVSQSDYTKFPSATYETSICCYTYQHLVLLVFLFFKPFY